MSGCGGWTADTVQDYLKSKKVEKKLKKIKDFVKMTFFRKGNHRIN